MPACAIDWPPQSVLLTSKQYPADTQTLSGQLHNRYQANMPACARGIFHNPAPSSGLHMGST